MKKNTQSISIKKLWLLYDVWENLFNENIKSCYHHFFIEFVVSQKNKSITEIKKDFKY